MTMVIDRWRPVTVRLWWRLLPDGEVEFVEKDFFRYETCTIEATIQTTGRYEYGLRYWNELGEERTTYANWDVPSPAALMACQVLSAVCKAAPHNGPSRTHVPLIRQKRRP